MNWVEGVGQYIGDDGSTYVVVRADTNTPAFVVLPGTFGRGNTARQVVRRQGRLVVLARDGERTRTSNAPEIVLENNMQGFWEPSGQVLYCPDRPTALAGSPKEAQKTQPALPREQAAPSDAQDKLPHALEQVVEKVLAKYTLYRGTGGTLILRKAGVSYVPSQIPEITHHLTGQWRFEILRRLRQAPGSRQLTEVPVERFDPHMSFKSDQHNGTGYWFLAYPGQEPQPYVARSQGIKIEFGRLVIHGRKAAANNSPGRPLELLGIVHGEDRVRTRTHEGGLELLIWCPPATTRRFDLLVANKGGGLQLLHFEASRTRRMELEFGPGSPGDFLVARDTKGKARVFQHP